MIQDTFPYMVTAAAPEEYPIQVHIGYLLNKEKQLICGVPKTGLERGGWQYDGSEGGQGGNEIPSHLTLTYMAYAEKKFYQVDADLPTEKFLEVFKKGYDRLDQDDRVVHETYTTLTVGLAPGGVVVIWLSGNKSRVEICRLQAKETFVDVDDFFQNADNENEEQFFESMFKIAVPDSIRTEIAKSGIPYGLWDKYRDKYKYRFVLKPYDEKDKITSVRNLQYNGEEKFITEIKKAEEYYEESIPNICMIGFMVYHTEIVFNDKEMLQVFNTLKSKYPDQPIDIVITPTFMYNEMKVSVKCGNEEVKLEKYKVVGVWGG